MASKKYRFVSPGVQLRELDRSQIPDEPEAIGPVIIGRSQRGPALQPVKVQNFTEFVQIFGAPQPGGKTSDVAMKVYLLNMVRMQHKHGYLIVLL
jgi:hypothetical protein